ncbi:hypothetical protein SUGI_0686500 [Cryptomeria japonica]|nr:hypothetical protein SUGI_0686500 [Cryptomeria japonica]
MERIGVDLITPPSDNGGAMLSDIVLEGMNRSIKAGKRESAKAAEQLRRNKMKELYTNLESLMPTPFPKGDRCKLVKEANNYVKKLQDQISQLNQQKDHPNTIQNYGKILNEDTNFIEVNVEVGTKDTTIINYGTRRLDTFGG